MTMLRAVAPCLAGLMGWSAPAQEPQPSALDYRAVALQVDSTLRKKRGMRLEFDGVVLGILRSGKPTNRVIWTFESGDQRLVGIEIEPLVQEDEGTTLLLGALLHALDAVDTVGDGIRMADLVREAEATDGRPRMVRLRHGIRLYRQKSGQDMPRFQIGL